jgi:hypothetical protein
MEIADAEAQTFATTEAAAGGVHADCGRCEGVVGGEDESAPILAAVVWGAWWAGEDVVPESADSLAPAKHIVAADNDLPF